ncbi:MAG: MaoC/PaaZ C-terminal domain-containing protein [Thermoplasmatota archaeon]
MTGGDFEVRPHFERRFRVSESLVQRFVRLTGDSNPLHRDPGYAATTRFGRCVVPGMLLGSFVAGVLGSDFPGTGTVLVSHSLRFRRPVFVGEEVVVGVAVAEAVEGGRLRLAVTVSAVGGEVAVTGQAVVVPPSGFLSGGRAGDHRQASP